MTGGRQCSSWSGALGPSWRAASAGHASSSARRPEPDTGCRTGTSCGCAAVFCCCTRPMNCGLRISIYRPDLGGAKGIRTPDLLHAISRQHIRLRPSTQVTVPGRVHESSGIQAGCGIFLLYRAEPVPLRTPADTRPVESLRFTALAARTTHAIGIARPASPAVTAGRKMGANRYAARIGRSIPPERRRAGRLLVLVTCGRSRCGARRRVPRR
jgi:hypothetical protein